MFDLSPDLHVYGSVHGSLPEISCCIHACVLGRIQSNFRFSEFEFV